ncbi:MAG TPA: cobalt-precorrin-6A reductase [Jatrophihabitans sp.]|jgi:precorrin-6A/cobalt-precorrin-6A reductase
MRVLILGGTSQARGLAELLDRLPDVSVISSLAGRVKEPARPVGEVRIGGFGGADGLAGWLRHNGIDALVDATHPFAVTMSRTAAEVSCELGLPMLVLTRPGWSAQPGDRWLRVPTLTAAAEALADLGKRVLLTTGRNDLAPFRALESHWFLIRTVDPPAPEDLPARSEVLLARGPFAVAAEIALMESRQIDVLVTKDSGGDATSAKLEAARQLAIPVVMVDRPVLLSERSVPTVSDLADAVQWVASLSLDNAAG